MTKELRWTSIEGQWHAEANGARYMAVPADGEWFACTIAGTKHKRGQTLSPSGEAEEQAKARCQSHFSDLHP